MTNPERKHTGLRVALATALGFSGAAGAVLAGKAILEGTSRQPVSANENQEGGIMPSAKTFNELVTQTPFPITPTVTETPTATSTSTVTSTTEPTASTTPTGTATKPASTATGTATSTEVPPTKVPATATTKPTQEPVKPSPAPTAAPVEQPTMPPTPEPAPQPKVEPKPEAPSAAFPKEIGNLERDSITIHNKGNQYGMVAKDFAYLSQMAKKYGVKVEYFLYDTHKDNPYSQQAVVKAVSRNPEGWAIPYGKEMNRRAENGAIHIHLSFDDNFREIISGQIFPNDQFAQFRRESIESGSNGTVATILRFNAPRSEWPKSFGPAPEDLLKLGKPLPNLQLVISP